MSFLETAINAEDEKQLTQILESWKQSELKKMKASYKKAKAETVARIEESLVEYKEELEEEYIDKTNQIIESLKPQIKKQVLTEMTASDPKMLFVEKLLEMAYPLINEDSGKAYVNEISLLKNENDELKRNFDLLEGEKKKEELLSTYKGKTKKILEKLLGEGSKEEIVQKFYELNESFAELENEQVNEAKKKAKKDEDEDGEYDSMDDKDADFGDKDENEKPKKKAKKSDKDEDEDDEDKEDEESDGDEDGDKDEDKDDEKPKKKPAKKPTKKEKDDDMFPESYKTTVKTTNINESNSLDKNKVLSFKDRLKNLVNV